MDNDEGQTRSGKQRYLDEKEKCDELRQQFAKAERLYRNDLERLAFLFQGANDLLDRRLISKEFPVV
jgi:hypothetical protein